ncbi:MAG: NAD(P)H-hydrate dehydratase, partial [Clostridia bacterium]|nr:NAD(P)H-hydrate dehydratase [Clostridia bacterium]
SSQMFAAESAAVARGGSFLDLMERAGCRCAEEILKRIAPGARVCVLVGKGKNGGDGYVIARELHRAGCEVHVLQIYGEPRAEDAIVNRDRAAALGIQILDAPGPNLAARIIAASDAVVDAVFGTGFRGAADDALKMTAEIVAQKKVRVFAIDVPSGANADTAQIEGAEIRADVTFAIAAKKPIHVLKPNCSVCGETIMIDIGILPEELSGAAALPCAALTDEDLRAMLPPRIPVSNKGTYGHALCVCGSRRMIGAGVLSVRGALRSGAGLVTAAFPDAAYNGIAPQLTEPLLLPLASNDAGSFSADAVRELLPAVERASAALIGCGLAQNEDTAAVLEAVLRSVKTTLVIDADGINLLSRNTNILKELQAKIVLTPHPGEMRRLTGLTVEEILADPVSVAANFAQAHHVTVLLKGANTVITDGTRAVINTTGNDGLAKGGSGDLLAGLLVGLCAQGMQPFEAAAAAAYLHGKAAELASAQTSRRGMLPGDAADLLPVILSDYE